MRSYQIRRTEPLIHDGSRGKTAHVVSCMHSRKEDKLELDDRLNESRQTLYRISISIRLIHIVRLTLQERTVSWAVSFGIGVHFSPAWWGYTPSLLTSKYCRPISHLIQSLSQRITYLKLRLLLP